MQAEGGAHFVAMGVSDIYYFIFKLNSEKYFVNRI